MDLTADSPCIIGAACRLPGAVLRSDSLWSVFTQGPWKASSTLPPLSRGFSETPSPSITGRGGWLGQEGVEEFDPHFFGISESEAVTLRPNVRLALELTHEALEHAGIPPSTLRSKNVAVSVGVGTEDGWDMKRRAEDGLDAFDDCNWAAGSDPSGVPGRVAHVFDFRGPCAAVSNACASGAFALRDGIRSLYQDGAEVAVVGALSTHFGPAPFAWARAAGVASRCGRSLAFSPDADGYSPSEGGVFFVLKRRSAAELHGDPILGVIRALACAHNGATKTFMTPSMAAQVALTRTVLSAARLNPGDVTLLEAHGTGTPVGDALEMEAIQSVFGEREGTPLFVSSSKTVLGHCHGAAALVGVLKVLACFEHQTIPSHHVDPHPEFLKGSIVIPQESTPLKADTLIGQINSFGFTGSIASIVLEKYDPSSTHLTRPLRSALSTPTDPRHYLLPFSGKSPTALEAQIRAVASWAVESQSSLRDLAALLGVCRDHHKYRRAVVVSAIEDLVGLCGEFSSRSSRSATTPAVLQPDDRITIELLNLRNLDPNHIDDDFQQVTLANLLKEDRVLEAACLLYERGHALSFSAIYDKRDLEAKVIRGCPFYQFDRKRYWKDSPAPLDSRFRYPNQNVRFSPVNIQATEGSISGTCQATWDVPSSGHASSIDQVYFEGLIETYGAPMHVASVAKPISDEPSSHFLLTGGNGMLGARVLSRLLDIPNVTVYCIIRGDPWARLSASFAKHRLRVQQLREARSRGSLRLMQTTDLCGPNLGLSDADYALLVESVQEIIHAAWTVNFNLPLKAFLPLLECTRALAELCVAARERVRYHFVGSYASTFNYAGKLVPERVLEPRVADSLAQGYAVSKLVAEHSLLRIHEACPAGFELSIIRVGQVCGDTATGAWSRDEMMPMIIASLRALRALPRTVPDVSWIPSDVCADALRDFVISPRMRGGRTGRRILHLANPKIRPWDEVAREIEEIAGVPSVELLSWQDYVDRVKRYDGSLAVSRLLPYFVSSLEDGTMPRRYASLEVSQSLKLSSALASCPPIGRGLLELIVRGLLDRRQPRTPPPVFLFGPWVASAGAVTENSVPNTIERRIMMLAEQSRSDLGDTTDISDTILERQLKTLASQLTVVQTLSDSGIVPGCVLGYCFGEYSAAITAGILSEETVVDMLVRRAMVLRDIEGAMLNAFCEINVVRCALASVSSPPSIAIHAGPKHVVLSGSHAQVRCAEAELCRRGVRTLQVGESVPFHSDLMEGPARKIAPFACAARDSVAACYVSGVTGARLEGHVLGFKYWLRHLREPVKFYRSMEYLRTNFARVPIVEIGPGDEAIALGDLQPSVPMALTPNFKPQRRTPLMMINDSPDAEDPCKVALELLKELFGYATSSSLLSRSLHSVGLQSLDFIRFADHFRVRTGLQVRLSAFVSDAPLEAIISEARGATGL